MVWWLFKAAVASSSARVFEQKRLGMTKGADPDGGNVRHSPKRLWRPSERNGPLLAPIKLETEITLNIRICVSDFFPVSISINNSILS